jgi:hypothetical protein
MRALVFAFLLACASFSSAQVVVSMGAPAQTLSWTAPTQDTNGNAITIAYYLVQWSKGSGMAPLLGSAALDASVTAWALPGSWPLLNPACGTYYFTVTVVDTQGFFSSPSQPLAYVIPCGGGSAVTPAPPASVSAVTLQ